MNDEVVVVALLVIVLDVEIRRGPVRVGGLLTGLFCPLAPPGGNVADAPRPMLILAAYAAALDKALSGAAARGAAWASVPPRRGRPEGGGMCDGAAAGAGGGGGGVEEDTVLATMPVGRRRVFVEDD